MNNIGTALILGENGHILLDLAGELMEAGYKVKPVSSKKRAVRNVIKCDYDVFVLNAERFGRTESELVRRINRIRPDMFVILLLDRSCEKTTDLEDTEYVEIFDCLTAPYASGEVLGAMNRGMLLKSLRERMRGNSIPLASVAS
jgi:DNA-binding NtrC family response regulator